MTRAELPECSVGDDKDLKKQYPVQHARRSQDISQHKHSSSLHYLTALTLLFTSALLCLFSLLLPSLSPSSLHPSYPLISLSNSYIPHLHLHLAALPLLFTLSHVSFLSPPPPFVFHPSYSLIIFFPTSLTSPSSCPYFLPSLVSLHPDFVFLYLFYSFVTLLSIPSFTYSYLPFLISTFTLSLMSFLSP